MVGLGRREAIVDKERCAARQQRAHGAGESFRFGMGLGDDVVVARNPEQYRRDRAVLQWPVFEGEGLGARLSILRADHATLVPAAASTRVEAHRHRIEHFVADHHTLEAVRQGVQPGDAPGQMRGPLV